MNAASRLGAYAVGLAVVLGAGLGIGAAVGPIDGADPAPSHGDGTAATAHAAGHPDAAASDELPAGLSASAGGYTFAPDRTTFTAGQPQPFSFRILGPDGAPVTDFDVRHERELHLVVVSGDLVDYQHLHPTLGADGTWTVPLALPRAGTSRAYADFAAAGAEPVTLAVGLDVAGDLQPRPLPAAAADARVDGYDVHVEGAPTAGASRELHFRVARGGVPVDDLEPYLGAYGHLVAIRAADDAYLHVHPTDASTPSEVVFAVHAPSPGPYRLFLDFSHGGVVRTASFTVDVPAGTDGTADHEGGADHAH